jgi:hypothetical protein
MSIVLDFIISWEFLAGTVFGCLLVLNLLYLVLHKALKGFRIF